MFSTLVRPHRTDTAAAAAVQLQRQEGASGLSERNSKVLLLIKRTTSLSLSRPSVSIRSLGPNRVTFIC